MGGKSSRQNGQRGGRPKGRKNEATLSKEAAREVVRQRVLKDIEPMVAAQIANAKGISHFLLRDPKTGRFERLTDVEQIQAALNADGAEEGSSYYVWTKDPSVQSFTDLLNRTLDKPKEQEQEIKLTGDDALIGSLLAGRKRAAELSKSPAK